jgi:hypothetical protein
MMAPLPSLTGVTCWSVGRRDPEAITAERPGQFAVEIMFDDPEQASAWCAWIIAHDEVWRAASNDAVNRK